MRQAVPLLREELERQLGHSFHIFRDTQRLVPRRFELRRIIYTTNIIEGLNRQFRKVTKNKPSFTNDDSLRKMLYLASKKIVEHWTVSCRNWDMVLNQLNILFADRIPA